MGDIQRATPFTGQVTVVGLFYLATSITGFAMAPSNIL
jgi:hypothetical protein